MKTEAIVVAEVTDREIQLAKSNGGLEIVLPPSMHTTKVVVRVARPEPLAEGSSDGQGVPGAADGPGAGLDPGRAGSDLPA